MLQVANSAGSESAVGQHALQAASASQLVIVDGIPCLQLSNLSDMPEGVYIGGIQNAPSQVISHQLVSSAFPLHWHKQPSSAELSAYTS